MKVRFAYGALCVTSGWLAAQLSGCCGAKPFVMGEWNNPGTPAYVCHAPQAHGWGHCEPDPKTDETRWNQSGTVHATFHAPFPICPTGIQRILIRDPSAADTEILVECAPPPAHVDEAGP